MKIINVNENNFENEVKNIKGKVLVDFNADWCGPCKMLKPILEEIASESDYKIVSINTDENMNLSEKYEITSIPCLILFENGIETKRSIGLKSKSDILNMIGEK